MHLFQRPPDTGKRLFIICWCVIIYAVLLKFLQFVQDNRKRLKWLALPALCRWCRKLHINRLFMFSLLDSTDILLNGSSNAIMKHWVNWDDIKMHYIRKHPVIVRWQGVVRFVAATYSPTWWGSTIGDGELNFSVRNGKRWILTAITATIYVLRKNNLIV